MISRIALKNFQGHQETVIDFDKGINVITGSSSAGKTSIMRGVSWLMTNRPTGNAIISYWNRDKKGLAVGETSVEITTESHTAKRIKNKDTNGYVLDGRELNCIGLDVPSDVTEALQLDNLNIHKQLDPHFLLSETPGEVARYLNGLIGLSAIDKILSKADSEMRACNKSIVEQEAGLADSHALVNKYSWAVEAEKLYKEYTELEDACDKVANTWALVTTRLQQIEDSTVPLDRKTLLTVSKGMISQIDETGASLVQVGAKTATIFGIIADVSKLQAVIGSKPLVAKATDLISTIDTTNADITALRASVSKLQGVIAKIGEQSVILDKKPIIEDATVYIERLDKFNKRLEVTLEESRAIKRIIDCIELEGLKACDLEVELKKVLASLPATCPLCGGELKGDSCVGM